MLLLDCLAQQTVKPEKPAVDGQLDWYVDWSLWTANHLTWWTIDFHDVMNNFLFVIVSLQIKHLWLFWYKNIFRLFIFCSGMWKFQSRPSFIKKSSHTQPHTLRALFLPSLSVCSSWNLPPQTPTSPPLLNFFFFLGGTLRKNVIQHIQASAPKSLLQTCSHWFSQRINCSK